MSGAPLVKMIFLFKVRSIRARHFDLERTIITTALNSPSTHAVNLKPFTLPFIHGGCCQDWKNWKSTLQNEKNSKYPAHSETLGALKTFCARIETSVTQVVLKLAEVESSEVKSLQKRERRDTSYPIPYCARVSRH